MLYQRREVNVRKHKRNLWARKQIIDQSQLSDRVRNCRRIQKVSSNTLDSTKVGQLAVSDRQLRCATKLLDFVACLTWAFFDDWNDRLSVLWCSHLLCLSCRLRKCAEVCHVSSQCPGARCPGIRQRVHGRIKLPSQHGNAAEQVIHGFVFLC